MEPTAIGNAVIWHRGAKSEERLWDWEISFRVDRPPHHFPTPRKHSLRRTCFMRGTSTPHIFKGGSWVRAPVSSLPPAFSQTRAVTPLGDAVGSRSGAGCSAPGTEPRGRCALWACSQPTHERFPRTHRASAGRPAVSTALLWLNESPSRGRINRTSTWFYQMQALSRYLGLSLNNWYFEFVWFISCNQGAQSSHGKYKKKMPFTSLGVMVV